MCCFMNIVMDCGVARLRTRLWAAIFAILLSSAECNEQWNYTDPDRQWGEIAPLCTYQYQSPINMVDADLVPRPRFLTPFMLDGYAYVRGAKYVMLNNGHTVQVNVESGHPPRVDGAGLPGTYALEQFHFHWGLEDDRGSEHEINGRAFPLELHLVHYKLAYGDIETAATKPDGLAVIAILFEFGDQPNPGLQHLIDNFQFVHYRDEKRQIPTFSLTSFLPDTREKYYRYEGSLTTPPCYESVTWSVFRDPVSITHAQIQAFRDLEENVHNEIIDEGHSQHLGDNFRGLQPLNQRVLQASWSDDVRGPSAGASSHHPGHAVLLASVVSCGLAVLASTW